MRNVAQKTFFYVKNVAQKKMMINVLFFFLLKFFCTSSVTENVKELLTKLLIIEMVREVVRWSEAISV